MLRLFDVVTLAVPGRDEDSNSRAAEARAHRDKRRIDFAESIGASRVEGGKLHVLRHFCPLGCCRARGEALEKVLAAVDKFVLPGPPQIPACNRWTKLLPPMCFWTLALFFGVVPHALRAISGHYIRGDALVVTEEDLLGMGGEETFERKCERRMKKVLTLADPLTDLSLLVSTTLLHATLSLMGLFFADAHFDNA